MSFTQVGLVFIGHITWMANALIVATAHTIQAGHTAVGHTFTAGMIQLKARFTRTNIRSYTASILTTPEKYNTLVVKTYFSFI